MSSALHVLHRNDVTPRPQIPADAVITPSETALYRHRKRPRWGLAILVWDRPTKCAFQFEDGKMRLFKRDYLRLFEQVDPPEHLADHFKQVLQQRMESQLRIKAKRRKKNATEQSVLPRPEFTVKAQHPHFLTVFPGGFEADAWQQRMRGVDAKRRLKRHRNPIIEEASEVLDASALKAAAEGHDVNGYWGRLITMLDNTTLTTRTHRKPLEQLREPGRQAFLASLYQLLYGERTYARRFEHFVSTFVSITGRQPTWHITTVWAAIRFPEEHICVRPANFRRQARGSDPDLIFGRLPGAFVYQRALKMAERTKLALQLAGETVQDFLDIHDFIHEMTKPKTVKAIKAKVIGIPS